MRIPIVLAGLAAALLAAPADAQFTFQIAQPQSNFTWSGTTSLGPLQGNPSQNFQVAGTAQLVLGSGGNPVGSGQILSSVAAVVPDLHAMIPNPLPFLPPLATVDVTNLVLDVASQPFTVDPGGNFTTTVVLTALSGTMTITPFGSTPTVQDLTGSQSTPTATNGTLTQAGSTITLVAPVSSTFDFADPGTGTTGTLTVTGTLVANYACAPPSNYCSTSPNSVGAGAIISSSGSTSITANDLVFSATGAAPNQFGVFYFGPNAITVPFGQGVRCVGGGSIGIFRLPLSLATAGGVHTRALDHGTLPLSAQISAGDTRYFQCWYRDPQGGGSNFNLSDGRMVRFCP